VPCKIQINPVNVAEKDQSEYRKEFDYDGQKYTLVPNQILTVPDEVASAWTAHDSEVETVVDEKVQTSEPWV